MEAEIVSITRENLILCPSENDVLHSEQSTMVTELPSAADNFKSKVTSPSANHTIDGADANCDDEALDLKLEKFLLKSRNNNFSMKNKRKRRRGKPKSNIKPYKNSNWKFQKPRNQQNRMCEGSCNGVRSKLVRSRSIVPYNTNDFLMEEHMAEVPGALLTPSGRTRDSSFSVDSEDNYFFSLPEDEEEFLTKEFANVYERARVERLEAMTKQQLIEECLQLEHKYADGTGAQMQATGAIDFMNKVRILEERIRDLSSENMDLRRRLERRACGVGNANKQQGQEQMCSSTSEDSESDSSSSSSSCSSIILDSGHSRRSSISDDEHEHEHPYENNANASVNDSQMDSDDIPTTDQSGNEILNQKHDGYLCNGLTNGPLPTSQPPLSPSASSTAAITLSATASPLSSSQMNQNLEEEQQQQSPSQLQQQQQGLQQIGQRPQLIDANSND